MLNPLAKDPSHERKPRTKNLSSNLSFLPNLPQQYPRIINAGILVVPPRFIESNNNPNKKPEKAPFTGPSTKAHGSNHNSAQPGPTPTKLNHDGEQKVRKGTNKARNWYENLLLNLLIEFFEFVPNQ